MTDMELLKEIVKVLDKKKARDIKAIEITEHSIVADYFVICSGTSNTHVKSLADEIEYELKEQGVAPYHIEGKATGWILLDYNSVLENYFEPEFTDKLGFLKKGDIKKYSEKLIEQYDIRSSQGSDTITRSMSGGNQQKVIVAREIEKDPELLIAVQPTRGLDVGAIEYIHKQIVAQRDAGKGVLLVSLELEEVMDVADRILVMYEGEIVGELNPKTATEDELGLYMAGAKRDEVKA